jgi:small basic protein
LERSVQEEILVEILGTLEGYLALSDATELSTKLRGSILRAFFQQASNTTPFLDLPSSKSLLRYIILYFGSTKSGVDGDMAQIYVHGKRQFLDQSDIRRGAKVLFSTCAVTGMTAVLTI